jgi:GrpB-like predicted nucleotidyltransferase (UPF0157 family)
MLVAMTDAPQPEFLTPPVRVDGPITLAEANPAWPDQFAREDERTKRELAARRWAYVQDYADAKSSVVEGIIARAREDREPM